VQCPNGCYGFGECLSAASVGFGGVGSALSGGGWCSCDAGWTGMDCSAPIFQGPPVLPYGDLFPNETVYVNDTYGDYHPIYNLTVFGLMKILLPLSSWNELLLPSQAMNEPYYETDSLMFWNPSINFSNVKTGMRLKGTSTRMVCFSSFFLFFFSSFSISFFFSLVFGVIWSLTFFGWYSFILFDHDDY
jgi:hypothetical protein